MRRFRRATSRGESEGQLNLTPMLDVVFIMLIFFIVTATFIKQAGIDVTRPDALTADRKPTISVIVAINAAGEIWIDNDRLDPTAVRAKIEQLHAENPRGGMVIQADRGARTEQLIRVLEAARGAGVTDVAVATQD
jgi:biopolymer transport protein ExbD